MDFLEEVEEVPAGLITAWVDKKEVGIEKIAPKGLVIRMRKPQEFDVIKVSFYDFKIDEYQQVAIHDGQKNPGDSTENNYEKRVMYDKKEYAGKTGKQQKESESGFRILEWKQERFYWKVYVEIFHKEYETLVRTSIRAYQNYVIEKCQSEGNEFSKTLVGYPCELDDEIAPDFQAQKRKWLWGINKVQIPEGIELAVQLDTPDRYTLFLRQDFSQYMSEYWKEQGLTVEGTFTRIYIGNAFCPRLFPEESCLYEMLMKAKREELAVTLVTSFLRESEWKEWKDLLQKIGSICRKEDIELELEMNDYGMLSLVSEYRDVYTPILGVLLNKRRKDSRMIYKNHIERYKELLGETGINTREMQNFLRKYGITRYEYEADEIPPKIPTGTHSLHLPYYQTNTSSYCPLMAKLESGDRGRQRYEENCRFLCRDMAFLYPDHLKMVGRYNSLFGVYVEILENPEIVSEYVRQGVDRVVVDFL